MKKFFTLIAVALMATAQSFAQTEVTDYENENITVGWKADCVQPSTENGVLVLTNETAQANFWAYQYWICDGIALNPGTEYNVTFTMKAEGTGTASIRYKMGDWGNGEPGSFDVVAGGDYQNYTVKATAATASNGFLLQHGDFVGKIYIKKVKVSHVEEAPDTRNHVLKVTTAKKSNTWDSQIYLKLANLEAGKAYNISLQAKADGESVELGTELIDLTTSCVEAQWSNSVIFSYTASVVPTGEYTIFNIAADGKVGGTDVCKVHEKAHTGDDFAAKTLMLNIGKFGGDLYIDNLTVTDEKGAVVYSEGFENNLLAVSKPSWHSHISYERVVDETVPTGIKEIATATKSAGIKKFVKNGEILIEKNGKLYNHVGVAK